MPPDTPPTVDFDRLVPKAEMLLMLGGVTFPAVWQWIRAGKFPRGRYMGTRVFWRLSEIESYIEAMPKSATATEPAGRTFPSAEKAARVQGSKPRRKPGRKAAVTHKNSVRQREANTTT